MLWTEMVQPEYNRD